MLDASNITLRINAKYLLHSVSVSFATESLSVIVGANGAGKSTLLKVLSGDITPNGGQVSFFGDAVQSICPKRMAQQRSVMPQSSALNFSFQVDEVVEMGRAPHITHCSPQKNRDIVKLAMKEMDVDHLRNRDYTTLSGGEKQRVHLARVVAQVWEPEPYKDRFILLDEPTSSLDLHHQHQTLSYLKSIAQQGVGIVVVLHDLNLASLYADHIVVMKDGERVVQGSPRDVFQEDIILDAFHYKAHIHQHPDSDCPLIIPAIDAMKNSNSKQDLETQLTYS